MNAYFGPEDPDEETNSGQDSTSDFQDDVDDQIVGGNDSGDDDDDGNE